MRFATITIFFILFLVAFSKAQPPTSNIYVFDYQVEDKGAYHFSNAVYLTGDNRDAYNNQPFFIKDGLLISSVHSEAPDVYKFDLISKKRTQLTSTPESEYSPKLMPDGKHFTVVRVSADSLLDQQLWQYQMEGKEEPKLLLKDKNNIGYYNWVNDSLVVLFIVSKINRLELHNLNSGETRTLKRNVGRCFINSSENRVLFVDKREAGAWFIKEIDLSTFYIRTVVQTIDGSEDFVLAENGELYMGKGSFLYKINLKTDYDWVQIADFSSLGISKIQRFAMKGNKICIVDVE